jgi:hypothetical protein
MTVQPVTDPQTPISEILKAAGSEGIVLESGDQGRYALIPLDDDLIDFLIERSPKLRAECRQIRERMAAGGFRSHEDVKRETSGVDVANRTNRPPAARRLRPDATNE